MILAWASPFKIKQMTRHDRWDEHKRNNAHNKFVWNKTKQHFESAGTDSKRNILSRRRLRPGRFPFPSRIRINSLPNWISHD